MNSPIIVQNISLWPTERFVPAINSPRTHPPQQIRKIAKAIKEFGFVNPILAGPDGVIIAGHGRLLAAKHLKLTLVPVIELDHLKDYQRRALALADNRIPLDAGWDEELLSLQLAQLRDEGKGLELTGFDDAEVQRTCDLKNWRCW